MRQEKNIFKLTELVHASRSLTLSHLFIHFVHNTRIK